MKRTLVVWALLPVIFVVFYEIFSYPLSPGAGGLSGVAFALRAGLASLVRFQPVTVFLSLFFVIFLFKLRRNLGGVRLYHEGMVLMQQGRKVEALARFQTGRNGSRSALPSAGIGTAQLSMWRIPEAVAAFEDFKQRSGRYLPTSPGSEPLVAASLALARAIQGDVESASALLKEAVPAGEPTSIASLAELVLLCRSESWASAREALVNNALLLDQLGGVYRALSDALKAWVASKTSGAGGEVNSLRLFHETSADGLKQAWPEFIQFVQRVESGPQNNT